MSRGSFTDERRQALERRRTLATPRGAAVVFDAFAKWAENEQLRDASGREFIDCASGIAVLNTGHRHPRVMAAVRAQLEAFTHTAYQVIPYESYIALAERLNALVPIEPPAKTAFFTTGAEAVENAIKIAQAYTGRSGLIACVGGFHGRTALGMTLTGKVSPYKVSATSAVANVFHTPFPKSPSEVPAALLALDNILRADIDPKHVAAILVEPVQGEGGFHVAPEPFLAALRGVCTDHGIQLIADEIQTGFARTGKMFAMEHYGIKPDLMTLAKSLAGGLPLSAVCGRAVVMDALAPGGLGGTYAGNPLAIAASHAVLDVIESEKLCKRAEALGARMRACLLRAQDSSRRIAEVRGLGSMMAFEMKEPGAAKRVQAMAFEKGVLLLTCGMHGNAIRVLYPLTIGETSFAKVLDVLDEVFRELR